MKINFKREKKVNKDNKDIDRVASLEKILFRTCVFFFIVLVSIQIILVIPSVRSRLNLADKSLGVPLGADEYLYKRGLITLTMISKEPDPTVRILVNGEEIAMFENLKMPVSVNDGDVIEIDGTGSLVNHIIKVENISSNINSNCLNAYTNVEANMKRLVKVQFN
jgi:hypothetical protein